MKGDKLGRQSGSGNQERNHEGRQAWETRWQRKPRAKSRRKLGRQGGSGSQERNHEGRQAWARKRQRQPRAKPWRETSLGDKAAAAAKSETTKGDKFGRRGAKSEIMEGERRLRLEGGSGSQERNYEGRQAWATKRQRQPRAKSWRETKMGDKAAAAAKSETTKGDKFGRRGAKSEIMKGDKFGRQGGSGSQERNQEGRQVWETRRQERNHEGRQVWETRRQRQPRAKSGRETNLGDEAPRAKS